MLLRHWENNGAGGGGGGGADVWGFRFLKYRRCSNYAESKSHLHRIGIWVFLEVRPDLAFIGNWVGYTMRHFCGVLYVGGLWNMPNQMGRIPGLPEGALRVRKLLRAAFLDARQQLVKFLSMVHLDIYPESGNDLHRLKTSELSPNKIIYPKWIIFNKE